MQQAIPQGTPGQEFDSALRQASMTFALPKDFSVVPVAENPDVRYQYAISSKSVKLEIRYLIRSLASDAQEYERNGREGADPNTFYRALLLTMCLNLSGGAMCTPSAFDPEDVKKEFHADAGSTAFVKLNSDFGKGYRVCLINVIHVQNKADAFTFFLFDDLPSVQAYCFRDDVFHALKFR
jgi:hypothetical protein